MDREHWTPITVSHETKVAPPDAADRIAALEAELQEARMQGLAAAGQAQDHMEKVAALEAENARLRAALKPFTTFADRMADTALAIGLAGTSDWDTLAGTHDIFTIQDAARAALQENDDG